MNNKKRIFIYISITILLFLSGCNNSSKSIPLGLSCEINGKEWSVSDEYSKIEFKEDGYKDGYKIWGIKGDPVNGPFETVILYFKGSMKLREYLFSPDSNSNYAMYNTDIDLKDKKSMNDFESYKALSGKMTITIIDKIHLEGTFEFTACKKNETQKLLSVTNGKFSLRFPD